MNKAKIMAIILSQILLIGDYAWSDSLEVLSYSQDNTLSPKIYIGTEYSRKAIQTATKVYSNPNKEAFGEWIENQNQKSNISLPHQAITHKIAASIPFDSNMRMVYGTNEALKTLLTVLNEVKKDGVFTNQNTQELINSLEEMHSQLDRFKTFLEMHIYKLAEKEFKTLKDHYKNHPGGALMGILEAPNWDNERIYIRMNIEKPFGIPMLRDFLNQIQKHIDNLERKTQIEQDLKSVQFNDGSFLLGMINTLSDASSNEIKEKLQNYLPSNISSDEIYKEILEYKSLLKKLDGLVKIRPATKIKDIKKRRKANKKMQEKTIKKWTNVQTKPQNHDPAHFNYIVHGFREPIYFVLHSLGILPILAFNGIEVDVETRFMNLFQNPAAIADKIHISASYIDQDHRATHGPYGFILDVPGDNIIETWDDDPGEFLPTKAWMKQRFKKRNLTTPNKLIKKTEYNMHNELLIIGTHPQDPSSEVKISGIFIKLDETGRPLIPLWMIEKLELIAKQHNLAPPVYIEEPDSEIHRIPKYRYWQVARYLAGNTPPTVSNKGWRTVYTYEDQIKLALKQHGLKSSKTNVDEVISHLETKLIFRNDDEQKFSLELKKPTSWEFNDPWLAEISESPKAADSIIDAMKPLKKKQINVQKLVERAI